MAWWSFRRSLSPQEALDRLEYGVAEELGSAIPIEELSFSLVVVEGVAVLGPREEVQNTESSFT